jgi:hypothetical protein
MLVGGLHGSTFYLHDTVVEVHMIVFPPGPS